MAMSLNKQSLTLVEVRGKRVLVREDLNVPLQHGVITDDARIREALPTLRHLIAQGARVIIAAHFGRPGGQRLPEFSLAPVRQRLSELLGGPVALSPDCVGAEVEKLVEAMTDGEVLLLENLRFHAAEEKNDPAFAQALAGLAEVYVNDAFGASHRAHASTAGLAQFVKPAVAGFLMEKEIRVLARLLAAPARPFVTVLGGAKVSDKIGVIENLLPRVDQLLIGGAMAHAFFKAKGYEVGKSLLDPADVPAAQALLVRSAMDQLRIPTDVVVAPSPSAGEARVAAANEIGAGWSAYDIGPATSAAYAQTLRGARTIFWNGPLGLFETARFAEGTRHVAQALAEATAAGALTVAGGGDSGAALKQFGLSDRISHVSTGGGASLEFLEGKELPGVAALDDA